jgi:CRISPR-associated protein Csy3
MSKNKKVELAGVLSFERKLETSDALMYSGSWGEDPEQYKEWKPIEITTRQNRSTISALNTKEADMSKPNPVSSDSDDANLPSEHDTLKVSFSLRIIGNLGKPFACNNPDFEKAIVEKVNEYKDGSELKTLAKRYAYNIANGRFLWRNRVCAEDIQIVVRINGNETSLSFHAYDFSLQDFAKNESDLNLKKLEEAIYTGLNGDSESFTRIEVNAYVKLGKQQHVFPSQEMNMGEKKMVLFQLGHCAAIHNVKIGNAIRTIDDWYEDAQFPIAVEPFGAVTQIGQAFRKSKNDLYTLMQKWVNSEEVSENDQNFVVANLIRGGVFGGKNE